ncbi:hypothetical protein RvY_13570 [Ramazzottius varieornatus]|uniref:Uncharacterized protein n=1 Tax=Ramazzottius varieornatus TaxID=947166 RepID=A0A1D1VNB7_RAMVA|nr:hypothetical protein RvY_13570 [Ramazzottius varieornatus]
MKSLALVYLSCTAIGKLLRSLKYYPAILNCITRDCPDQAVTNADMVLLAQYKRFLINYCTNRQYQASKGFGFLNRSSEV